MHRIPTPAQPVRGEVCLSAYRQHVQGGVVPPKGALLHLKSQLLPLQRQALICFRVGSYPLGIATGRNEGDGSANAQQGQAPGGAAHCSPPADLQGVAGAVEDMQHSLLECPFHATVRQSWDEAFGQQATTVQAGSDCVQDAAAA